jgi:16S rRNA U516 pseudouridylate synthase RsuA-like enzyme
MSEPIRLSKRLIELVGCSRREAELFIEGGWVTVDGEVIDEPQFKVDNQKVELDPQAKATAPEPVTILLNAPAGPGHRQRHGTDRPGLPERRAPLSASARLRATSCV